jgi:putative oxidoreductase
MWEMLMEFLRFVARCLFAGIFVASGYEVLTEPGRRPEIVAKTLPLPQPELMVRINGAAMLVGGAALALAIKPRLAAAGLAASLVPTTYAGHQFWVADDPAARRGQQVHFEKNLSMIGALLTYALSEEQH